MSWSLDLYRTQHSQPWISTSFFHPYLQSLKAPGSGPTQHPPSQHLSPEFFSLFLCLQPSPLCNQFLRYLFIGLVSRAFSHDPHPYLAICSQQPLDVLVARCLTVEGGTERKEETHGFQLKSKQANLVHCACSVVITQLSGATVA